MTAGSFVKRDQTLANVLQSHIHQRGPGLSQCARIPGPDAQLTPPKREIQRPGLAEFNVKQYRESLRNLGVSDRQIDDMIRTRQYSEYIEIVAPADGFITARNVSQGQRFEKGVELYRVVDLSRVWILVDVFDVEDSQLDGPGRTCTSRMAEARRLAERRASATTPAAVRSGIPSLESSGSRPTIPGTRLQAGHVRRH